MSKSNYGIFDYLIIRLPRENAENSVNRVLTQPCGFPRVFLVLCTYKLYLIDPGTSQGFARVYRRGGGSCYRSRHTYTSEDTILAEAFQSLPSPVFLLFFRQSTPSLKSPGSYKQLCCSDLGHFFMWIQLVFIFIIDYRGKLSLRYNRLSQIRN